MAISWIDKNTGDELTAANVNEVKAAVDLNTDKVSFDSTSSSKLDGIANNATANSADATLLARSNHTGTQLLSTVSDAGTAASRDAEDTLTDGANLPDGAAIKAYGDSNWSTDTQLTDSEVETAYNNQVAQVSGGEITAGTETGIKRYSPANIKSFIDTHAGGGTDDQTAAEVSFAPFGTIAATTVQTAIEEVFNESTGGTDDQTAAEVSVADTGNLTDQENVEDYLAENRTAINLNTAKETNVSTNLSEGTATETTVDVNSSDGSNATLVSASTSRAGLLTKAKYDEIVANTAKVSMSFPSSGIAVSTGSAWDTSYTAATLVASLLGETWTFTGDVDVSGATSFKMGPVSFEGLTEDDYETHFSVTDPTADRYINIGDYDTRIPAASAVNSDGTIPNTTVISGSKAMGTTAIAEGSSRVVTDTAIGAVSTDVVQASGNADPLSLTGYAPTTNGGLFIEVWASTDQVNFRIYNNTATSITPSERTINWRITR